MDNKTRKELYRIQRQVVAASGIKKSALPIIRSVFVRSDGTGMRGTNLDCWFDIHYGAASGPEALLSAEQAVAHQGHSFTVDGNRAMFESGASLLVGNSEDYPAGSNIGERCYSEPGMWAPFRKALAFVALSRSNDLTRIVLCGVMLDGKRMVGTDGHRLSSHPYLLLSDWDRQVILEPSLLGMLLKLPARDNASMRMDVHENGVHIRVNYPSGIHARFTARLVDGPYPNVDKVIPKSVSRGIALTRLALVDLLKLSKPTWSRDVTQRVRLSLEEDKLTLSCKSDGDKFESTISAVGDMHEPFAVNGNYLMSVAKSFDSDTLGLNFQDVDPASKPMMIYGGIEPQPFVLLMPLRLAD